MNSSVSPVSPHLSFSILSLLFHISFIHLISLPSSFVFLPVPFSLSFSFCYIYSTCTRLSLFLHSTFCTFFPSPSIQYLLSLFSFPHINLTIIFLSLKISLPRYSGLSVSLSLSLSSTFFHLPFALSTSSLAYLFLWYYFSLILFLFSPAFRQFPALFSSIHFVFKLCPSLSLFHFQPRSHI
jgi:hypothetical protein